MLNANEVRAMARKYREFMEKAQKKKATDFLDSEVMPKIEALARKGATYTFCEVPEDVSQEVVLEILAGLGYKVLCENKEINIRWE